VPVHDITLSAPDRRRFLSSLMSTYHTPARASNVLEDIGLGPGSLPPNDGTPEGIWREALRELESGRIQNGLHDLLGFVLERYPSNATWVELAQQYAPELVPNGDGPQEQAAARSCHVMVRAANAAERQSVREFLTAQGLAPTEMWSTSHMTLFAVRGDDADAVRERLERSDGLEWTVIPPDGQTYLYSQLIVQGPDGRYFRFNDVPAQQAVADLAADTLAEYPDSGTDRRTVTDRVQANGQGVRLGPESTLHEAGVRDGDRLRVAYETNAGAVNPLYHSEALVRAGNQIRAFVDTHPEITMWANAPDLATVYELEFKQSSFGPPPGEGLEPIDIEDHVVQLDFGPDFPQTAPMVFWLTEIFHPNIYPNYDSPLARKSPPRMGLVCLGDLTDAFQPALDLGQLCQTLLDVAAFRNYGLILETGKLALDSEGQYRDVLKGNVFDPDAAIWVVTHQERIAAMGGRAQRNPTPRGTYRNEVEDYVP